MTDVNKDKNKQSNQEGIKEELLKFKKEYKATNESGYLFKKQLDQTLGYIETICNKDREKDNDKGAYVIGVSGERGSGKSSFLYTLKSALDAKPTTSNVDLSDRLETLDIIDPGIISNSLSLIEIILGNIRISTKYIPIEKKTGEYNEKYDKCIQARDALTKSLKDVVAIMAGIKGGIGNFYNDVPTIAVLDNISKRYDFASKIKEVIDGYLRFCDTVYHYSNCADIKSEHGGKNSKKSSHLVLFIDDLDMVGSANINEMLEDIRKYLPNNVIAVLTYRHSQLMDASIQQKLIENNELLNKKMISLEAVRLQTVRYFEKLMPLDYRITLFFSEELYDKTMGELLHASPLLLKYFSKSIEDVHQMQVEDFVMSYIYQNTRIQLKPVSLKEKLRIILPTNLRGLLQLLTMMVSMQDIKSINQDEKVEKDKNLVCAGKIKYIKALLSNLEILNDYILNHCKNYMEYGHMQMIYRWSGEAIERKNYNIYHQLYRRYTTHTNEIVETSNQDLKALKAKMENLNSMFKASSLDLETFNVSIANVYTALENYKDAFRNENAYFFSYAMKVLYSILILKKYLSYNQAEDLYIQHRQKSSSQNNTIQLSDYLYCFKAYYDYQKLIGGKIIPDNFCYFSRAKTDDMYIKVTGSDWKKMSDEEKSLLNKLIYTSISKESGIRTNAAEQKNSGKYVALYDFDLSYEKIFKQSNQGLILPIDPMASVIRTEHLANNPELISGNKDNFYSFYSLFDIDVILSLPYSRNSLNEVLKKINKVLSFTTNDDADEKPEEDASDKNIARKAKEGIDEERNDNPIEKANENELLCRASNNIYHYQSCGDLFIDKELKNANSLYEKFKYAETDTVEIQNSLTLEDCNGKNKMLALLSLLEPTASENDKKVIDEVRENFGASSRKKKCPDEFVVDITQMLNNRSKLLTKSDLEIEVKNLKKIQQQKSNN